MYILGIESSCDETAAAIVKDGRTIVSSVVASQIDLHKKTGGVVPEVAARSHVEVVIPVVDEALRLAKMTPRDIQAIAVTYGPGLIPALLIGVDTARALAMAWKKPLVAVNHMAGHLHSFRVDPAAKKIEYPVLALLVSGGHTELLLLKNETNIKILGQTRDDAAGEAFDKVGKVLGLPYPGGPAVSRVAVDGDVHAFELPRPMLKDDNLDFSFSGLKTAVIDVVREELGARPSKKQVANLAASFQQAVVDVLVGKTMRAAQIVKPKLLVLGGGVAANTLLRESLKNAAAEVKLPFLVPPMNVCTDNAIMIAVAGSLLARKKKFTAPEKLQANPNLILT